MPIQCSVYVKVNFEKKNPVLPFEKFRFPVLARNTIMCITPYYLPTGRLKWSRSLTRGGRLQEVPNIM